VARESGVSELMLKIVTSMKVSTWTIRSQVLVFLLGSQAIFTEDVTKKMSDTAMVKCTGLMEVATKVSGKMEFSMVWVQCRFLMAALKKGYLKIMCTNIQRQILLNKTKLRRKSF
jgi:hypothetical protein